MAAPLSPQRAMAAGWFGVSLDPSGSLPGSLVCLCTCELGLSPCGFVVAIVSGTPLAGATRRLGISGGRSLPATG